jgi:hypothetical protein
MQGLRDRVPIYSDILQSSVWTPKFCFVLEGRIMVATLPDFIDWLIWAGKEHLGAVVLTKNFMWRWADEALTGPIETMKVAILCITTDWKIAYKASMSFNFTRRMPIGIRNHFITTRKAKLWWRLWLTTVDFTLYMPLRTKTGNERSCGSPSS